MQSDASFIPSANVYMSVGGFDIVCVCLRSHPFDSTGFQNKNINIIGPFSADSLLITQNLDKFDCFVFIYHDQALIPFKFISQFSGVNYTGNLNIIRTSPDHGTAYNLLGSNKISNKSFIEYCLRLFILSFILLKSKM